MKRLLWVVLLVALALLGASSAEAQPSIASGRIEVVDGRRTLKLTGTGFGTRGNYNRSEDGFLNVAWHDFENGQFSGGGWSMSQEPEKLAQWTIETAGARTAAVNRYARKVYKTTEYGSLQVKQQGTTGYWFLSYWTMMPTPQQSGKIVRIYGDTDTAGNIFLVSGGNATYPNVDFNVRGTTACNICGYSKGSYGNTQWSSPDKFIPNLWQRVDILMRDDAQFDEFSVYLDGKLQWSKRSVDGKRWVGHPFGANGHTLHVGAQLNGPSRDRNYGSPGAWNFDDVYLDYTSARIELGDAPIWQNCRHKEIQIPRTWSDVSISVDFNPGSFASGQQVWVFVVDRNGVVSTGAPLVVPASTTIERAPRPTGIPKIG